MIKCGCLYFNQSDSWIRCLIFLHVVLSILCSFLNLIIIVHKSTSSSLSQFLSFTALAPSSVIWLSPQYSFKYINKGIGDWASFQKPNWWPQCLWSCLNLNYGTDTQAQDLKAVPWVTNQICYSCISDQIFICITNYLRKYRVSS